MCQQNRIIQAAEAARDPVRDEKNPLSRRKPRRVIPAAENLKCWIFPKSKVSICLSRMIFCLPNSATAVSCRRKIFTRKANIDLLRQLVQGKSGLIKKALGLKDLPIEEDSDELVFPWFADASGLSPDEVKAYTAFISALCKLSANAKRVSMTEKPVDNEKYAFRCFLLRLGFIGREHKITRKILLRNLEGSSAFKNGGADDEASE